VGNDGLIQNGTECVARMISVARKPLVDDHGNERASEHGEFCR